MIDSGILTNMNSKINREHLEKNIVNVWTYGGQDNPNAVQLSIPIELYMDYKLIALKLGKKELID